LAFSGVTTTASWIFYYKAIKIGNVSEVALLDKASIIITLLLSFFLLHEQFTWKIAIGGLMIIGGLITVLRYGGGSANINICASNKVCNQLL
jgi:transporter family protein